MKNYLISKGIWVFMLTILLFSSCKKKAEVLDNVVMEQAFSLPLGEKSLSVNPPVAFSSEIPGKYGTFEYNGKPYPVNDLTFDKEETIEFNMDSLSRLGWLQRVDFKIRITNAYPVNGTINILLLNSQKQNMAYLFDAGGRKIAAAEVNSSGDVQNPSVTYIEIPIEGDMLTRLKATKYLTYRINLDTYRSDKLRPKITDQSNLKINLAMRLFVKYNINEI